MAVENKQLTQASAASAMERAAEKKNRIVLDRRLILGVLVVLLAIGAFFGVRYWADLQTKVFIEKSIISAPVISVGPEVPGVLKTLYVKEGDRVVVGQQLFNVGDRVTYARAPGIVTAVQNTPGQFASSQNAIVQMYDPSQLRVTGHVQEDQGLSDIRVGQKVVFTVDAYGSKEYSGTVERIGLLADQGSLVFNISDKRQMNDFSVTVAFDLSAYPELKNGMSAKMSVYK